MTQACTEELVWATTEDGANHDGVVIRPTEPSRSLAVVWIHGFSGRFCEPFSIRIGRQLASEGYTVVSGNNRGHHLGARIWSSDGKPRLAGAWWEKISESPLDIAAWISYAEQLRYSRVALVGHSYGAVKCVWYQGERQDARVAGVVAASGPIRVLRGWDATSEMLANAEQLVEEGRGYEVLVPWDLQGSSPSTMSAQALVDSARSLPDVYGVGSADSPLSKVHCPILALFGTNEERVGTAPDLETIRQNARSASRVDTAMIEGADHSYTGREAEVGRVILRWLGKLA
jgi:pimeloyl-ACP methyl ester carboxylesterase